MHSPPSLFDSSLLALRRQRAARRGGGDFLHRALADETAERLKEVNRSFPDAAVIGPRAVLWAEILAASGFAAAPLADAEVLALAPASVDLLVDALTLHWVNDPLGRLIQARRALRPDGLYLGALLAGQTLAELRSALAAAETEILGGLSPRVAPMAEIRSLGALLQRAGLALPVADTQTFDVRYGSALDLMRDLRAMGETNVLVERLRRPAPRALFLRADQIYSERFGAGDGRVRATFEVVFLSGWAPSSAQPQPLRPGTARTRLADALGVPERDV